MNSKTSTEADGMILFIPFIISSLSFIRFSSSSVAFIPGLVLMGMEKQGWFMNRQASARPCLSFGIEDRLSSGDNLMKSKIEGHEVIMAQKNKVIESLRITAAEEIAEPPADRGKSRLTSAHVPL